MKTEVITTHDIRVGDRIANHGMVLLVDHEPQQTRHEVNVGGITLATRALIENWDEVSREADGGHDTMRFIRGRVRDDMYTDRITEPRWTIQGNGLAHWARIIREGR